MEKTMASIVPFISNAIFEPEDIKAMSDAYDRALEKIRDFGHPNKIVKEIVAKRIIKLAKAGERDLHRLCDSAMAACRFNPDRTDGKKVAGRGGQLIA
jgi:hypothetical protein